VEGRLADALGLQGVMFEPSGVDHQSPGSSWMVGQQLVREIFGAEPPIGPMYAFVGISGMAKMSSSKGGVPTAEDALRIMEPQLLRWLYARRRPNQAFNISFDQEIQRTYDEWDALERRIETGTAAPVDVAIHSRAARTAAGELPTTPRKLPFRTLASVVDITTGDEEQTLRILRDFTIEEPVATLEETRPRLDKAEAWVTTHVEEDQRTRVRTEPDAERLATLGDSDREALKLLLDGLDEHWSLDGLTTLVYAVPKLQAGLTADAKPTPELKTAQRSFFALLYQLLVGRDTGPRLPTLLLAVGADRVRKLLAAS
jgi:lysyl-tRNA synthetase, class I